MMRIRLISRYASYLAKKKQSWRLSLRDIREKERKVFYVDFWGALQIDHFPHSDRYVPHTNGTFKQRYCKYLPCLTTMR